ncbi:MAG TPA: class I SAM-dependent methyltransferase [Terriglobia bacterium]|nr:class I SAM-dependent methyltransferase [Terriglobia bacterium]
MSYTAFDRVVAWLRFRAALPHVRPQTRVCDIGCGLDARFLHRAGARISLAVGIDDQLRHAPTGIYVVRGDITRGLPFKGEQFDHAVMLAVLEHLANPQPLLADVYRMLTPGGSLIMTWPQAVIDPALDLLHAIGLISKEMESDEHQSRIPIPRLLSMLADIGFIDLQHRKFEFGLNNLLICHKPRR